MKQWLLGGLCCLWITGWSAHCEASMVSRAVGNVWGYATSPVPCLTNWLIAVGNDTAQFVACFLGNMNPGRLIP